ncbi:putative pectinesterase inhibitor domain-containing protein [Lupinus albus]|uniref:Putative pectinesterase inhibitor domain-containing protein n=1 Tax=Lupinus albus TaxID=3870 RepID=A0A6A4Q8A5_LUPAL|nr:putative pectinesterase inhibitor domain-containing protein [Lupinus albus]
MMFALILSTQVLEALMLMSMVKVMETKANDALNKIHDLQNAGSSAGLSSCASKYNAILVADIPSATEALQKGNPQVCRRWCK